MPRQLKLELIVDDKGSVIVKGFEDTTHKAFDQVETKAKTTSSSLQKLLGAAVGIFALTRIKSMVTEWVGLSGQQQQATAGMEQALRSMGRYTPELKDQLLDLASAQQEVTTFGDEATIAGQKFLITYKAITDDLLPEATKTMLDLAALMGGDTMQAANMLGKASMGLSGELRRVGITIDENIAKSGDFAAILREIQKQVGGQARALAETDYGGLQQLGNLWGDAKEDLGDLVLVLMRDFYPALKTGISLVKEMAEYWGMIITPPSVLEQMKTNREKILDELMELQAVLKGFEPSFKERMKKLYDPLYVAPDEEEMRARVQVLRHQLQNINETIAKETGKAKAPPPPAPEEAADLTEYYKEQLEEWEQVTKDFYDMEQALGKQRAQEYIKNIEDMKRAEEEKAAFMTDLEQETIQEEMAAYQALMEENEAYIKDAQDSTKKGFDLHAALADETARNMLRTFDVFFYQGFQGKLEDLGDYASAFWDTMLASFAHMCSMLLVEWAATQAAMAWTGLGGWGGLLAGIFHGGAVVGNTPSPVRIVPEDIVRTAKSYHAGLDSNERVGIFEVGEIVLPKEVSERLSMMPEDRAAHIHLYIDGREVTNVVMKRTETDGTVKRRFQRALV